MTNTEILAALDKRIERLEQVKQLLQVQPAKRGPGRPRAMTAVVGPSFEVKRGPGRPRSVVRGQTQQSGKLSAEGRARISAAQKARWAKRKKAA